MIAILILLGAHIYKTRFESMKWTYLAYYAGVTPIQILGGELKWSDFSDDLGYIHLSGNRNKSGKNRIVPVPIYIRELLDKGQPQHNIFRDTIRPLNEDYFKTLWSRFKKVSKLLEQDQTLYSFRRSGAIEFLREQAL